MRLILKNFRCFKHVDISFENYGTTLIWGTSGIGKTSIFKAINFVLYGKEQKIVKHGEKKCSVELFWEDLIITRTRCPNHLRIKSSGPLTTSRRDISDDDYQILCEDDVAQNKIDSIFGKNFLLTSYMAQKSTDSFFYLSSVEKAAFLQKLAIKDFNVDEVRKKVREIIRSRKDKLIEITTEKRFIEDQINQMECYEKEPQLSLDKKDKTIEEFIKHEEELRLKNINLLKQLKQSLKEKSQELIKQQDKLTKKDVLSAVLSEKENQIEQFQNEFYILKNQDFELTLEDLQKDLEDCKNMIKIYDIKRQWKQAKLDYDEAVQSEETQLEEELKELEDQLKQLENISSIEISQYKNVVKCKEIFLNYFDEEDLENCYSLEELEELLESLEDSLKDNINNLKKTSELLEVYSKKHIELLNRESDLKKNIEILKNTEKKALQCPSCDIHFYIDTINTPEGSQQDIPIEITDNVEDNKNKLKDLKDKLYETKIELEKLKQNMQTVTKKIDKLTIDINKKEKDITLLKSIINQDSIPSEINKEYIDKIDQLSELKNRYQTINKNITEIKKKLEFNPNYLNKYLAEKRNKVIEYKKNYEWLLEKNEDLELWDEDEARKELPIIANQLQIKQHIIKQSNDIKTKIKKLEDDSESIENELTQLAEDSTFISTLSNEIKDIEEKISVKENLQEKLTRRKEKIEKFINDHNKYTNYQSIKSRLDTINNEESILLRALSTSQDLFNKINEAETISLQTTVDNINTEMEEYINSFFGENFTVKLSTFKETKDGDKKSCIDIVIIKDGENVPLESLSGGEFDRVALAIFLGFNKVSKSKLIILDECLSSLHAELVEEIVEMIKNKLSDKIVLITLHQSNTGMFDNVIDIEQYRCCGSD